MANAADSDMTYLLAIAAFFDDYADVARVASAAFMILQIIIILDYACACCLIHAAGRWHTEQSICAMSTTLT